MEDIDDAQHVLERKALANVRALVEKAEAEDRNRSANAIRLAVRTVPALFVGLLIAGGVATCIARNNKQPVRVPQSAAEFVEQTFRKIERKSNENTGLQRQELDGLNGRVGVGFDVKPNGYIDNLEVIRSSGDSHIDGVATRMTKSCEPYVPLPTNSDGRLIHIAAFFRFTTDSGGRGSVAIEPIAKP